MNKYIAAFSIAALMLPSLASAQTMSPQQRTLTLQLISLLTQEVQYLESQLAMTGISTSTAEASIPTQGTITATETMPDPTCTLSIGIEKTSLMYGANGVPTGVGVRVNNGNFDLSWAFDDGATSTLVPDDGSASVQLDAPTGTMNVATQGTVTYKLNVLDGSQSTSCSASATHVPQQVEVN